MHKLQQIRIIGGHNRGRKISFPNVDGLRPTGDRIRETLFNWLQSILPGSNCLDLFAGSGALGFEAASRGAKYVLCVEQASQAVQYLRNYVQILNLPQVEILHTDAIHQLNVSPPIKFDIVFVDPPFAAHLTPIACKKLMEQEWLNPEALIYIEHPRSNPPPNLPTQLTWHRTKVAGQVWYGLARYTPIKTSKLI